MFQTCNTARTKAEAIGQGPPHHAQTLYVSCYGRQRIGMKQPCVRKRLRTYVRILRTYVRNLQYTMTGHGIGELFWFIIYNAWAWPWQSMYVRRYSGL